MGIIFNILILLFLSFVKSGLPANSESNSNVLGAYNEKNYTFLENSSIKGLAVEKSMQLNPKLRLSVIYYVLNSDVGLAVTDNMNSLIYWLPEAGFNNNSDYNWFTGAGDVMDWWSFEDIDGDNNKELLAQFAFAGTAGVHPFYLYSYKNGEFTLALRLVEARSKTQIIDLDNDGIKEIVHRYALSGSGNLERETLVWKDIWRLENGKPSKVNNQFPKEYEELISIYDTSLTSKYNADFYQPYYPIYKCLKDKAQQNIKGQFANAKECQEIYDKQVST